MGEPGIGRPEGPVKKHQDHGVAVGEEGHCQVRGTEPSCFTGSEVPFLFVTSLEMGSVPGQGN